jgi:predicted TIM-barrel fold metal-dependent hydrolase
MLIDAHAHIFPEILGLTGRGPTRSLGYGLAAVGSEVERILPPYSSSTAFTPEMLIANLDWAGVDKAVLLQGPFYGECNGYAAEAIGRYPDRLAGVAYLDPWSAMWKAKLGEIMGQNLFRGVKLECSEASGLFGIHLSAGLDDEDLAWLWYELQLHKMILVLDLGAVGSRSYQTAAVRRIAESYPDLRIVIAHLGQLRPAAEADPRSIKLWEDQISLGSYPNVWFDCAALPAYLPEEDFPFPTAGRYIRMVIDKIGPSKILWGTDQPGLLSHASLPELVKMAHLHTAFLPANEQQFVLGENARNLFF